MTPPLNVLADAGPSARRCPHTGPYPDPMQRCRAADQPRPSLSHDLTIAAVTAAAVLVVITFRVAVQTAHGEVTGLDTGNFLTLGHAWLGDGLPEGAESTYPPIVPIIAAALGYLLPPLPVMIVLGVLASTVHASAVGYVLWRSGCGWWTSTITTTLIAGSAVGEGVAWGGAPQVAGLGLAFLTLYLAASLLTDPQPRRARALGLAGLALGATSHLVFAMTVAAATVMAAARFLSPVPRPTRANVTRAAAVWARAAAPSLLLAPLYLDLAGTVGSSVAERGRTQSFAEFVTAVEFVSREMPLLWRPAIVLALLVPAVLYRQRRHPLWLLTTGLATVLVGVAVSNPEPRFAYLVPLLVTSALGLLAATVRPPAALKWRAGLRAAAAGGLAATVVGGLTVFPAQIQYYGSLVPDGTSQALAALRANSDPTDVVAVPPVRGLPFGWWVEGRAQRPALVGSSEKWLNFPRERERANTSVRLFSAADALSDRWLRSVRRAGADLVYIPATYDGITTEELDRFTRNQPDLVAYSSSAATIVRVP